MLLSTLLFATMAVDPAGTVFVNFDGVELRQTEAFEADHAPTDTSWLYGGDFAPYGEGVKRAAVLQALRADWQDFDVLITDVRPSSGEYAMSVVTPTNPVGGRVVGFAPVDCWDQVSHSNVTFAFHSEADNYSATAQATTISQEIAHSFGLEHVDERRDIMNPTNDGGDPGFTDTCAPLVGPSLCAMQHEEFCDQGRQNAHAELMAMFGPARGTMEVPLASIVSPADGDAVEPGDDVIIEVAVSASADVGELFVLMHNGASMGAPADDSPWRWTLRDIDFGVHELAVITRDADGVEIATQPVRIGAGVDPAAVDALGERGDRHAEALACAVVRSPDRPAGCLLIWLLPALWRRRSIAA